MIIGTTDFGKLVDDSKVIKKSSTDNITVFAPTNRAVQEADAKVGITITNVKRVSIFFLIRTQMFSGSMIKIFSLFNEIFQKAAGDSKDEDDKSSADMANAHMVEGYFQLADLVDEQKINTLDGKSSIRFNEFYNPTKVIRLFIKHG